MADPKYTPNPLRPYYIPPSIGRDTFAPANVTANIPPKPSGPTFSFPDLDYSDYIPEASPSATKTIKSTLDRALWKYANILMAQPFEVAKLILQVRIAQDEDGDVSIPQTPNAKFREMYEEPDSDEDEPNYFASSVPFGQSSISATDHTPPRGRKGRPAQPAQRSPEPGPTDSSEHLQLKHPHSLLEVLSSMSASDGPFAIWKAANTTFVYQFLHRTIETFLRSFLAAVFGVVESEILLTTSSSLPDSSILNSTSPYATVLIATGAATLASLILAPIDTARTLQILLPSDSPNRSLLSTVRSLRPSWLIPTHLVPITFLTSSIPTFISTYTPLVLKNNLGLDPAINPTSWSLFTFLGSAIDLSVKFPLETVLRRAQIATWTSPSISPTCTTSRSKRQALEIKPIVSVPTVYRGVLPTIWGIMREEGFSESQKDRTAALMGKAPRRKTKGQGVEGLYRGWRVGLWGLVGIWGTAFVGGLQGDVAAGGTPIGGKF